MADNYIKDIAVPDAFGTIGRALNVANSAQNLQRGNVALEQERALLQPNIERGRAESETAKTQAQHAAFKLEGDQSAKAMQIAGGLFNDPRINSSDPAGTIAAATEARDQMISAGVPKDKAEWWSSQLISRAHQPGAARQLLQNVINSAAGSGTQASITNAPLSPVQTQQGTAFAQLQPGAPNAVTPVSGVQQPTFIPAGVAPTQTQQPGTDALGRPIVVNRDQAGKISYASPPGTNYRPIMELPQGETAQTAAPLLQLRDDAQRAAATAPSEHFNNQQILMLADDAFTGTGSEGLKKVLGAVGIQSTNSTAADTARLQHFLALQVENNAKAQGANTDAARSLAANAVVPGSSPAEAIKSVTKINDAYVTGKELFNQGLIRAINHPDNKKDIYAARDFQNAWSPNFDPNIMRIINAQKSGDTKELAQIKKELGADGMKALIPKYQALKSLYETGR